MIRSRKISFSLLIFRLLVVVKSISKCVVNEDHVDSVSVSGESGNQELAADSIHGFAVKVFGILPTPDTSFVYAFPSTAEILISFSSSQRSNASLSCTVK